MVYWLLSAQAKQLFEARVSDLEERREDGKLMLTVESARLKSIELSLLSKKGEPFLISKSGWRVCKHLSLRQLVQKSAGLKQLASKRRSKRRELFLFNNYILVASEKGRNSKHRVVCAEELREWALVDHADSGGAHSGFSLTSFARPQPRI